MGLEVAGAALLDLISADTAGATVSKTAQLVRTAGASLRTAPRGVCDPGRAGAPPDYESLGAWLAHPARPEGARAVEDPNHLRAAGAELPDAGSRPCDCFFVVDSCYTPAESFPFLGDSAARRWNLPLGAAEGTPASQLAAKVVEQMEMRVAVNASCFNGTCCVFAPVYRQLSIMALAQLPLLTEAVASKSKQVRGRAADVRTALEIAYDDVRRAFVRFVDDPARAGRPFVLAGHSQGTMHLVRLLQEEVECHPQRRGRFVHAYLAGFGVPLELFSQALRHVRPAARADDVGTVSSWRTASRKHRAVDIFRLGAYHADEGCWKRVDGEMLTTSPITWASGPGAAPSSPSQHKGAMWPLPSNMDPRDSEAGLLPSGTGLRFGHASKRRRHALGADVRGLVPVDCGEVAAQADACGFVRVAPLPRDSIFNLTERDWLLYHDIDYALFHNNIQENVALRIAAWRAGGRRR